MNDNYDSKLKMPSIWRHRELISELNSVTWLLHEIKVLYRMSALAIDTNFGFTDVDSLSAWECTQLVDCGIIRFDYIFPDFAYFKNNTKQLTRKTFVTLGVPDFIIEIPTPGRHVNETRMRRNIYSLSEKCEHWYITLESNYVECYIGKHKLPFQSLKDVLITRDGIEFDLRHLSL